MVLEKLERDMSHKATLPVEFKQHVVKVYNVLHCIPENTACRNDFMV